MQQIEVLQTGFEPWSYLADWQQQHVNLGQSGASAVFVGFMRDFNDGDTVQAMVLEHYPVMTQQQLTQITQQAAKTWQLNQVLLVHRVGLIQPTEPIVLVAVYSAHRADAFEACRFIMEQLKQHAPFWKKEQLVDGSTRWVSHNTQGYKLTSPSK
ncbi:MAG: molybdenum cofactor biosynthesis protein MoaE [Thiotrichaceae bacterium]|uniref:Molybdopterin synthase catalytic subunit n=1 Tax=Candidatus Thiocaldithrix dubininis TaxID=3080823 RepID=A0AA95H9H1_9GAMM|nr:MAG: molybdenum cofactor biosynthesis protein MoaE [Candidatus Thiocaldithrix dubininis]